MQRGVIECRVTGLMVRPTSVIWDFNGTIMDDVELAAASVSELLTKRNLPTISVTYHRRIFGFPVADYYRKLGFDLDAEVHSEISDEYPEVYLAGIGGCSLNEGVREMLMLLREARVAQYVLSAAELPSLNLGWRCSSLGNTLVRCTVFQIGLLRPR